MTALDLFLFALVALTLFVWWQATKPRPRDAPKRTQTHARETGVCVHVIDGDTMSVSLNGEVVRVRLIGVDAPERGKAGYHAATDKLRHMVEGKVITLERDRTDKDQYDRKLRYVWVSGKFVNRELVRSGNAKVMAIAPNTSRIAEIAQ